MLNLVIALALFAATTFGGYAAWYIVIGRHEKARRKGGGDIHPPRDASKGAPGGWGVDKDAYCYPKINDTMGFDFVKVVKIPDELMVRKDNARTEEPDAGEKLAKSRGTGTRNVTIRAVGADEDPEKLVRDNPEDEGNTMEGIDASGNPIREQVEEVTTYDDIPEEMIQEAQRNPIWTNREYDDFDIREEYIDRMLDENAERIEETPADDENARLIAEEKAMLEEMERLNQRLLQREKDNDRISEMVGEIMGSLQEEAKQEDDYGEGEDEDDEERTDGSESTIDIKDEDLPDT